MSLLIASLLLWVFFIAAAKVKGDATRLNQLNPIEQLFVFIFVVFDVIYNVVYGTILFLQLPPFGKGEKTLTFRLKTILRKEPDSWRGKLALFMCKYMIEPWDVGHCSLR